MKIDVLGFGVFTQSVLYKQAMADGGETEKRRKIVFGVDASEHSQRAFDCKCFQ